MAFAMPCLAEGCADMVTHSCLLRARGCINPDISGQDLGVKKQLDSPIILGAKCVG